jgi:hypothetical protein
MEPSFGSVGWAYEAANAIPKKLLGDTLVRDRILIVKTTPAQGVVLVIAKEFSGL